MTDWTPNTNQVRDAYVRAMRNAFIASAGEHEQEFNHWLNAQLADAYDQGVQSWGQLMIRRSELNTHTGATMDDITRQRQKAATERIMRRWLLEEASGNGPAVTTTAGPTAATNTWRYPYWPAHDVGYEEEER